LVIFDVEELPTHGGSLRIFVKHQGNNTKPISELVAKMLDKEIGLGFNKISHYLTFDKQVRKIKRDLLSFLIKAKQEEKNIVGYGAAAKGNTLFNYCGIRGDFIKYVVDMSPFKQGRYLPGSRIFIEHPERIRESKPDYILILPWNIKNEVMDQLFFIRAWGGKFIIPIPELKVV